MGDSATQVSGDGEGQCLSVCWRAWGHARQEAECAELALTMMTNREIQQYSEQIHVLGNQQCTS